MIPEINSRKPDLCSNFIFTRFKYKLKADIQTKAITLGTGIVEIVQTLLVARPRQDWFPGLRRRTSSIYAGY